MPQLNPAQPSNNKHHYFSNTASSFTGLISLVFFLHAGLSFAEPSPTAQENQSSTTKNNIPVNTPSAADWVKGQLLVMPRAGLPPKALENLLAPHGAKSKQILEQINVHIIELPAGVDEVKVMHALEKSPKLKFVELDMIVTPDLTVTDPNFSSSWALPKIGAPTAWDNANGDSTVIAILDTGVDSTHPDLAANIVPGWNMIDNNADTSDVHGHGTWVAGTAAAAANNNFGSAGVAWAAGIMPVRIADANAYGYFSTIGAGIRWAADNGAKIVNNSFNGVAGSFTIRSAAEYLRSKGGVLVVSAGNSGSLLNHAPSDSILVASATNSSDVRPSWSSYGPYVDIAAPGVSIFTTARGGGYSNVSGTSFSSPIVAATAALMLSANSNLTPTDVDNIIMSTALDIGTPGFDDFYGAGRVDAAAAVDAASATISIDNQAPSISITSPTGGEITGIVPVDVNYSDNVGVVSAELFVNGQKIITDNLSPFAFAWDTASLPDGEYTLTAYAFDAAGNQGTSANVSVTVNNSPVADTEAPNIAITSPTGGEVAGTISVDVNYSDNVGVTKVELYLNGQRIMTDSNAPFAFSLDTTTLADGTYTLTAHAFDEAGNKGTSNNVSVIITNNSTSPDNTNTSKDVTAPIITNFNLIDGMTVSSKQTISVSTTDNQSVTQITLTIDGKEVAISQNSSLSYNWNTRTRGRNKNKTHTVTVQVSDHAGNITTKTVTVYN